MPKMEGVATFRALHRLRPDLPEIIMSGYAEEEVSARFAGGVAPAAFLQKPFTQADLDEKLRHAISR